jgi:hypothetical protein
VKPVRENICFLTLRQSIVLCCLLMLSLSLVAQRHPSNDTTAEPPASEDSTWVTEQGDSSLDKIHYFDHIDRSALEDTVRIREVSKQQIDSLKKDDAFWYAGKTFKKKKVKEIELPSRWMSMTSLVIIVVVFMIILGWYLFQANILSRKQPMSITETGQVDREDLFKIDYDKDIQGAIGATNYRLAVRLLFLKLLKNLSLNDIIQYKQEKTNFAYLSEMRSGPYYNDFFHLARNYEYIWYGKFEIDKETFGTIKTHFENFDRKLS